MVYEELIELINDLREYSKNWERITVFAPEYAHGRAMALAADELERSINLKTALTTAYNYCSRTSMPIEAIKQIEAALGVND